MVEVQTDESATCVGIAEQLNIHVDSVRKILLAHNIKIRQVKSNPCKTVAMIDANTGSRIQLFDSTREAARHIIKLQNKPFSHESGISSHISSACRGKRKIAAGYKWQYI